MPPPPIEAGPVSWWCQLFERFGGRCGGFLGDKVPECDIEQRAKDGLAITGEVYSCLDSQSPMDCLRHVFGLQTV